MCVSTFALLIKTPHTVGTGLGEITMEKNQKPSQGLTLIASEEAMKAPRGGKQPTALGSLVVTNHRNGK